MDLATIKRKAEAAREFSVDVGGMQFTLRLPTAHQVEIVVARHRLHEGADDPAMLARVRRCLVQDAVVAWRCVKSDDILPGSGQDEVEHSREAVGLLMDERADVAQALSDRFVEERAARTAKQDAAEKN